MRTAAIVIIEAAGQFRRGGITSVFSDQRRGPLSLRHFALQELLGDTLLNRAVRRLERHGIHPNFVLAESESSGEVWGSVQQKLFEYAERGVKHAVLMRIGGYAEIDFSSLLRFHERHGRAVTWVYDREGPLHAGVLNLERGGQWSELVSDQWSAYRGDSVPYFFRGYVNRLESATDFRRLAEDALNRRCELQPVGEETRPGLWIGKGARIHKTARILAPAYVGANVKIRAGALITRNSSLERNSEVDCGTLVEGSIVLPGSYVGAGLELTHAVVDRSRLFHLRRNLELEIQDARLLGSVKTPAFASGWRFLPFRRPQPAGFVSIPAPTESVKAASL